MYFRCLNWTSLVLTQVSLAIFQTGNQLRQPKFALEESLFSLAILEAEKWQFGMQIRHLKLAKEHTTKKVLVFLC